MIEMQSKFLLKHIFHRNYDIMDEEGKKSIRALVMALDLIVLLFLLFLW